MYDQLAVEADCEVLQGYFDIFWNNHQGADPGSRPALQATGYMNATFDRMEELGCNG